MSYEGYEGFTITAQHEGLNSFESPFDSVKLLQDGAHKRVGPTSSAYLVDVQLDNQGNANHPAQPAKPDDKTQQQATKIEKQPPPAVPSDTTGKKPDASVVQAKTPEKADVSKVVQATPDKPVAPTPPKPPSFESWGRFGRKYAVDSQGHAAYEVKKGDTYAAVARDVLEKRNGRKFEFRNEKDKAEILKLSKELAAFNEKKWGSKDRVMIRVGDQIRIPAQAKPEAPKPAPQVNPSAYEAAKDKAKENKEQEKGKDEGKAKLPEAPKQPGVMSGSIMLQSQDRLYNIMQPPGFEGFPGNSWAKETAGPGKSYDIDRRRVTSEKQLPNGSTEYTYEGKVEFSGFWGTGSKFKSSEVVDAQRRIVARQIHYEKPVEMKLAIPGMENVEHKIKSVETLFDSQSGTYVARFTTKDGRVIGGRLTADGRPMRRVSP